MKPPMGRIRNIFEGETGFNLGHTHILHMPLAIYFDFYREFNRKGRKTFSTTLLKE